jgi:hypothetical protein
MLINKGVAAGEVVTFKLTSGEEVVAKLVEETETYYKLSRPMVLSMTQQGVGMMPYLFTVHPDTEVKLNKATITMVEATDKSFADQFLQSTTGIKLA